MKKNILIIVGVFLALVVFLVSRINKENLKFESTYESIRSDVLAENKDLYVLYIFSPGCPAIETKGPVFKEELDWLKENNIQYYLLADVIYNQLLDEDLDELREKYNLQDEKIYIMDKDEFPVNGGLFKEKARYGSFVENLTDGVEIPLGYIMHMIMDKGELVSFAPSLEKEKLPLSTPDEG